MKNLSPPQDKAVRREEGSTGDTSTKAHRASSHSLYPSWQYKPSFTSGTAVARWAKDFTKPSVPIRNTFLCPSCQPRAPHCIGVIFPRHRTLHFLHEDPPVGSPECSLITESFPARHPTTPKSSLVSSPTALLHAPCPGLLSALCREPGRWRPLLKRNRWVPPSVAQSRTSSPAHKKNALPVLWQLGVLYCFFLFKWPLARKHVKDLKEKK